MALPYTDWQFVVKTYRFLVEACFPSECLACGREGPWLCTACLAECVSIQSPTCPFCNKLSAQGRTCSRCRSSHALHGNRSAWYYRGPVHTLIHRFKYQKILSSQEFFLPYLSHLFSELPFPQKATILITSVPSSPERLAARGYNQSLIMAEALAKTTGKPYFSLLSRKKAFASQTKLTRKQRFANVREQFAIKPHAPDLAGTCVVIVDDVITTGATLSACASVLKAAGAKQIWSITVAKD